MPIQIKTIRVSGLRGLQNIEVDLDIVTVLTGMNNTGKTSFLKAMQIAFGNRLFITSDDFCIADGNSSDTIIVDIIIIPVDDDKKKVDIFEEDWEILFTEDRISTNEDGNAFVAFRTIVSYDEIRSSYKTKQFSLPSWPPFLDKSSVPWFQANTGKETSFHFDEVPFFYMDAQRDILEDIKAKSSFLGKMISKIEYSKEDVVEIEEQIKTLNEKAVNTSEILSNTKTTLKELDTAMDSAGEGIEITPFTKKIRDLNKGLSIYYSDMNDSFSMEYHGMGTRSWSSLLTLKSFIKYLSSNAEKKSRPFFPILAIEEPEAHLHPNAQKKLYTQIAGIAGQKIISTHSPYIAASAELSQIRSFYKDKTSVKCGTIDTSVLTSEDIRKIKRQVIATRGEIFFSKVIIFFEGETEEQALPIFAEHYFKKTPVEMGIDFVGVHGFGGYLPFLRFANSLKIPWFIFSDCENDAMKSVKDQFKASKSDKTEAEHIVFLDSDENFESQILADGFADEVKKTIMDQEMPNCANEKHKTAKAKEIGNYTIERLYGIITGAKTQFGPIIAETIIGSGKELPPKITVLFEKVKSCLNRKNIDE